MRHVETLRGNGTVTHPNGQSGSVRYRVDVYQAEIPVRTQMGSGTIPGMKKITGSVEPVHFFGRDNLVLKMQDGRTLGFFYSDSSGNITGSGGISET
jgi:hypothetical protein